MLSWRCCCAFKSLKVAAGSYDVCQCPTNIEKISGNYLSDVVFDLVGFSIVFPLFRELLALYQAQIDPLLAWLPDFGADLDQRLALVGGVLFAVYSLAQFASSRWWGRCLIAMVVGRFCC